MASLASALVFRNVGLSSQRLPLQHFQLGLLPKQVGSREFGDQILCAGAIVVAEGAMQESGHQLFVVQAYNFLELGRMEHVNAARPLNYPVDLLRSHGYDFASSNGFEDFLV